ncbi:ATP-dependent DNA helicase RecG [Patescibacteria group bacterium]
MTLSTPIEKIPQIGPVYQKRLKRLGIKTIFNLLFHLPHRYEDFSNINKIAKIKLNETCCIQGKIIEIKNSRAWKRRMVITNAVISDSTGSVRVVWFNQPYLIETLKPKSTVYLAGKVSVGKNGVYLSNPSYEKVSDSKGQTSLTHTGRIVPVYPETLGLSSRWLRFMIKPLLMKFKGSIPETIPENIRKEHNLLPLEKALWKIHFPDSLKEAEAAKERFSFEELFLIQVFVLRERIKLTQKKSFQVPFNLSLTKRFVSSLPFKLTDAQRKSAFQILKDLEKQRPMNRLLEGDVGSGKTVVAAIAALNVMKAGYQVAFMAPTEILSKQHFQEVSRLLHNFNVGLLTGKQDKFVSKKLKNDVIEISRRKLLEKSLQGDISLLIGTHALIQDKVKFNNLALVILDEQHRFGVDQRAKLCQTKKGKENLIPHLLSMTATPIPRTLALTIYGDLDLSLITELPKGRKKIITKIIPPEERKSAYGFIKKEVKKGRQVFVICPRIEAGNKKDDKKDFLGWSEVKAVKEEYEKLSKEVFPNLRIEKLYGKMTPREKEKIMKDMKNKKIDILVSTSVVEVGIDIPNATIMMIEGAERFGLAQLHQFRGRVGRSKYQSFCFLLTDSPAAKTKQRLRALIASDDGFKLAEKDLDIRGPGDFSGTRQWGIPDMAMSSLKDIRLVEKTRHAARQTLEEDFKLTKYPLLRERVEQLQKKIHLE